MSIVIQRKASSVFQATQHTWCGAAEIDITPPPGLRMAGYSWAGHSSKGVRGHLFARALYLEDATGQSSALCFCDLMSATRYLSEKVSSLTAASCGLSIDRVMLCGTHTHTGPGQFYGNSFYDVFAQKFLLSQTGFDPALADWLSEKIAKAIFSAKANATKASLRVSRGLLSGFSRNRSYPAFEKNPEANNWNSAGFPGESIPHTLSQNQRAIDPRMTVLTAVRKDNQQILAVFGTFACHTTALGIFTEVYSADWAGVATRIAAEQIHGSEGYRPIVAIANTSAGDITPLQEEPSDLPQGEAHAHRVGSGVGLKLAEIARLEAPNAGPFSLSFRFQEFSTADKKVNNDPSTELAPDWSIGAPALGGAEDGRSSVFYPHLAHEGMLDEKEKFFPKTHLQHPKKPALGSIQHNTLDQLIGLFPSTVFPLCALQINHDLLVSVPGEPSTVAAYRIESALRKNNPSLQNITVLGYTGDYAGYFTTPEEYQTQQYEGASMLYGKNVANHLSARLQQMVQQAPKPVIATPVSFDTKIVRKTFIPGSSGGNGKKVTPLLLRKSLILEVIWRVPLEVRIDFSEGPLIQVEQQDSNKKWVTFLQGGAAFDDQHQEISITRDVGQPGLLAGEAAWIAKMRLPRLPTASQPLAIRVISRANTPGFWTIIT
jgi:neutral ceramidase